MYCKGQEEGGTEKSNVEITYMHTKCVRISSTLTSPSDNSPCFLFLIFIIYISAQCNDHSTVILAQLHVHSSLQCNVLLVKHLM